MNDRREKIYQILCKQGNASLRQLKQEIYASDATLRRDLSVMEKEGLLIRTWGGAVSTSNVNSDPPAFLRSGESIHEKKTIARIATSFLRDNMTVFLASGTTVTRLAKLLHRFKNLTVITNGIDTAEALRNHTSAKVILTGGELYENYDMVGSLTENAVNSFNADIFFFSCSGITAEGFTCADIVRLGIITKMKRNSAKTVLLADVGKVGKKFTCRGFGFEELDHVVMDQKPNDAELRRVLGKKLITRSV